MFVDILITIISLVALVFFWSILKTAIFEIRMWLLTASLLAKEKRKKVVQDLTSEQETNKKLKDYDSLIAELISKASANKNNNNNQGAGGGTETFEVLPDYHSQYSGNKEKDKLEIIKEENQALKSQILELQAKLDLIEKEKQETSEIVLKIKKFFKFK
jgi:cell division protein FtsB